MKPQVERISKKAFDSLPEYSCSIPTGVFIGKVWKCNLNFTKRIPGEDWVIREYVKDPANPDYALIETRIPEIIEDQ